jgi:hypothetical protein
VLGINRDYERFGKSLDKQAGLICMQSAAKQFAGEEYLAMGGFAHPLPFPLPAISH